MSEQERRRMDGSTVREATAEFGAAAAGAIAFPYSAAGAVFTNWLNRLVRGLPGPTLMLGTRRARLVELHPDGRLEVEIEVESLEPEREFVPLEAAHLDQLLLGTSGPAEGGAGPS